MKGRRSCTQDLLHAVKLEAHIPKTTLCMAHEPYAIISIADNAPHIIAGLEAELTIDYAAIAQAMNTRARGSTGEKPHLRPQE